MANEALIQSLRKELAEIRARSLEATRTGDFMKVARCTSAAAQVNRQIIDLEARNEAIRTGADHRDAR
jgi:hypothetical protein